MSKANEPTGPNAGPSPAGPRTAGDLAKAASGGSTPLGPAGAVPPVGPPTGPALAGKPPVGGKPPAGRPTAPVGGPAGGKPGPGGPKGAPAGPNPAPKPAFNKLVSGTAAPKPPAPAGGPAVPPSSAPAAVAASSAPATTAVPKAPAPSSRPDLDAIHQQKVADSADRAAVRHIPATSSIGTPLRAAVQIRRVDPWSIFKVSGILAVAGFLIWMIAIAVLYGVLAGMGIWDQINSSFGTLVSADGTADSGSLISAGQVFGFSALFGVFGAIVLTALATILAYVYNVCADVVGGAEVTLADLD